MEDLAGQPPAYLDMMDAAAAGRFWVAVPGEDSAGAPVLGVKQWSIDPDRADYLYSPNRRTRVAMALAGIYRARAVLPHRLPNWAPVRS